jgi:hypothetical protein
VAGIAHAASNTAFAFIPLQDLHGLYMTWLVAAVVMILVDWMWKKLPPDHPAVDKIASTVTDSKPFTTQRQF